MEGEGCGGGGGREKVECEGRAVEDLGRGMMEAAGGGGGGGERTC